MIVSQLKNVSRIHNKILYFHTSTQEYKPVLLNTFLNYLNPKDNEIFIDMTFGDGGHSKKLLETADCRIITLDRDPLAFEKSKMLAVNYPNRVTPLLGRFSDLPILLKEKGIKQTSIDGICFDMGCSHLQLEGERGFSVNKIGYLDMRMDAGRDPSQLTARDVLATADEAELYKIFKVYGEEKKAAKIAQTIIQARYMIKSIDNTSDLIDLVNSCWQDDVGSEKSNAFKVFQSLRMFVNNELNEFNYGIVLAKYYLKINGRIITICLDSLGDTIVKRHISGNTVNNVANPIPMRYLNPIIVQDKETIEQFFDTPWKSLTKHVVLPSEEEIIENPQCRSARLRAAIKVK